MPDTPDETRVSVLLLGEFDSEQSLLSGVLQEAGLRLVKARDRRHAIKCLERDAIQVVIAESEIPGWNWKSALFHLQRLPSPPVLIVTSHNADDRLWSEVLNLGGYDVLARPFDAEELRRVVASAGRPPVGSCCSLA